jgi:hypothetical protein
MTHQPQLIPDKPSPEQAARGAERAEYLERLREKLEAPDFRAIEGFPIGEDEDIVALSDPPYYTACPNPFLPEIIERWQVERAQTHDELSLLDDTPAQRRRCLADLLLGMGISRSYLAPCWMSADAYRTNRGHKDTKWAGRRCRKGQAKETT